MRRRDDYKILRVGDVCKCLNQKVNLIAVILDLGFPKPTRATDWCCTLRIIDETYHQTGMAVNIFAENAERLPRVAAVGDIIQLSLVVVTPYGDEVNVVFNKRFSSFALYEGKDGGAFVPYQVSSKFHPRDEDKIFVDKLRKWLVNFQFHEDSNNFPMLREIEEGTHINLACKILHCCEVAKDEWFIFAWDGTDTPPNAISSKLENEINSPLPLQLEPLPLPRELLCTLPTVGSILKITFHPGIDKNILHLFSVGKWAKITNVLLEVRAGLWFGVITPFSKLRYAPNDDSLIIERQRLSDERISLKSGSISSCTFPEPSCITEVKHEHATPVTLMTVLTHSEVTARFKCIVRVVAAMPCQAENFCSPDGIYRMRLTLEDSTARIHALVMAEDGETLFDGYPGTDKLTKKLNKLLGVTECNVSNEGKDTQRNPPWVCVCLMSYCVSETDPWGTRYFKIFDTKITEET